MKPASLLLLILALLPPLAAKDIDGQQFVFFDEILTQDHTGVPALKRLGPPDLTSPVDYTKGRLYLRFEILEKPSELPVRPAYFIWQKHAGGFGHMGVRRQALPDCTAKGVYYIDCGGPADWWHGKYKHPDWTRAFDKMALVPWVGNAHEQLYSENCHDHCFKSGNILDHTPVVYRATGIWVAPGKRLVPPSDWQCPPEWEAAAR